MDPSDLSRFLASQSGNRNSINHSPQTSLPPMSPVLDPAPSLFLQYAQLLQQEQQQQQSPAIMPPPPRPRRRKQLNEQERFLLFTKSLFQLLKVSNNQRLCQQVKHIVAECTRRNRLGDPQYMPLQWAVETRVRAAVGDLLYEKLQVNLERYCQRKGLVPIFAC